MQLDVRKPRIAVSLGDFNGIGCEIVLKSLVTPAVCASAQFILAGSSEAFAWWKRQTGIEAEGVRFIEAAPEGRMTVQPGIVSTAAGAAAARAIECAALMCLRGEADAMVTAPISKEALHKARVPYAGHTEMLQTLTGSPRVTMILLSTSMRVALATIHRSIASVPGALAKKNILDKLRDLHRTLRVDFNAPNPRIAVLGLNPHAGERGLFGGEERRIIAPAIAAARRENIAAEGPFPADGFFARWSPMKYDAILAMYHDQGLIPLKMDAHGSGVNFSATLPIVRTSPDHGTAFDIAGKNLADPSSFIAAIEIALQIAHNRSERSGIDVQ